MILTVFISSIFATESSSIGKIMNLEGVVKVQNGIKKSRANKGTLLYSENLIVTSKNAKAKISLFDGSTILMDEKSILRFLSTTELEQQKGSILYQISKRDVKNSLHVKTAFAIIGVKGTRFIVNSKNDDKTVLLDEGLIGIKSIKEKFKYYKEKECSEYEKFLKEQNSAFKSFKSKQEKEFIAFVNEFDLEPGRMITFTNSRVDEVQIEKEANSQFEHFKRIQSDFK
jgi:hypothetical protein